MIPENSQKRVMGFESSCDETAVAIVESGKRILTNQIFSQMDLHQIYGGVVPEIAARAHLEKIHGLTKIALKSANLSLHDIDAVAVTSGPGLMGGLMVGVNFASSLAHILDIPCYRINHLEGHALSVRLQCEAECAVTFPYLMLLASGGHCQILIVKNVGDYQILGETYDDAAGETFDKAAHLLGLTYPGGPAIEQTAHAGNPDIYPLPRPLYGKEGCDFSFSGLKSAFRRRVLAEDSLDEQKIADFAAGLQSAIADIFADRLKNACHIFRKTYPQIKKIPLALVGGVASNQMIRKNLDRFCHKTDALLLCPPTALCTDNAAMIAWSAIERMRLFDESAQNITKIQPRWSLESRNLQIAARTCRWTEKFETQEVMS